MALRGWRSVVWAVALLAGAGALAQALAPTAGSFCYTPNGQTPQCFDTLG